MMDEHEMVSQKKSARRGEEDDGDTTIHNRFLSLDTAITTTTTAASTNTFKENSKFMQSILSSKDMTTDDFLETIWQQRPCVFPYSRTTLRQQQQQQQRLGQSTITNGDGLWNEDSMQDNPLHEIVFQGWHILTKLLQQVQNEQKKQQQQEGGPPIAKVARRMDRTDSSSVSDTNIPSSAGRNGDNGNDDQPNNKRRMTSSEQHQQKGNNQNDENDDGDDLLVPLIFHNRELLHPIQIQSLYGSSLFAAPYLDGCSIVINHGDLQSPWIAAICNDLQQFFPHAYANCYLTPPKSQAVPPHADDRDVLVIQVIGSKKWQVYETIPIPYPYPKEQVGKDGLPVPASVLEGPIEIETTLHPGDVLYMPRGHVHQAQCDTEPSFHITIALATHDWTLAGLVSKATEQILTQVVDFRQAVVPITTRDSSSSRPLQMKIDTAFTLLREQVTSEALLKRLDDKLDSHNRRAFSVRMNLIHTARFPPTIEDNQYNNTQKTASTRTVVVVGPSAAKEVTFTTLLRAATVDEKHSVTITSSSDEPKGLNVREENADAIMSLIGRFKQDSTLMCQVVELKSLIQSPNPNNGESSSLLPPPPSTNLICDLTLLCLAKRCVELGALAIVSEVEMMQG